MVLFIPKKAICACALAAALVTLAAVVPRPSPDTVPASTAAEPRTMLVLDAGHGGEDGGAVSDSGVAESGINLQITRRLYEILRFLGHPAVMTRTGDEAIYDDAAATLREKKVSGGYSCCRTGHGCGGEIRRSLFSYLYVREPWLFCKNTVQIFTW